MTSAERSPEPHADAAARRTHRPGRRRAPVWLLLLAAALAVGAGCRAKRIWTGIGFGQDGTLVLVAEEPMCGCLSVVNIAEDPVQLRSTLRGEALGEVMLKAAERQRFRFDWASSEPNSFYTLFVLSADGRPLDARQVLEFEDRPRWLACEAASCEFGALNLSAAVAEP